VAEPSGMGRVYTEGSVFGESAAIEISEVTRRNVFDFLQIEGICWWGRLEETEFLSRLYDLERLPSTDGRFSNATGDIWHHRVNNNDWDVDWVFTDGRFELPVGPDEVFLRFLCDMLHPVVRPDIGEVTRLNSLFNDLLKVEGWERHEQAKIAGRPVFAARRLLEKKFPGTPLLRDKKGDT
jgi:AbiJ N-terminal domain 3